MEPNDFVIGCGKYISPDSNQTRCKVLPISEKLKLLKVTHT